MRCPSRAFRFVRAEKDYLQNVKNAERLAQSYEAYDFNPRIIFQPEKKWHIVSLAEYFQKREAAIESKKASELLKKKVLVMRL